MRSLLIYPSTFRRTIELEEKYGGKTYQTQKAKEEKKKSGNKAAIGKISFPLGSIIEEDKERCLVSAWMHILTLMTL